MNFLLNKILLATCCLSFLVAPVYAQEAIQPIELLEDQVVESSADTTVPLTAQQTEASLQAVEDALPSGEATLDDMIKRTELNGPDVDVYQISSLFFSAREHSLLAEARQGFVTRPPGEGEIEAAENDNGAIEMGPRTLSLGGIVYVGSDDWVVWLNGQRVSANAIPSEILDIDVTKSYVKLQWFDAFTNQIFPVKLRAHQRFNIDTRIFLPG